VLSPNKRQIKYQESNQSSDKNQVNLMTYNEIQDLIKLVSKSDLNEIKVKEGDFEIVIRNKNYSKSSGGSQSLIQPTMVMPPSAPAPAAAAAPAAASAPAATPPAEATDTSNLLEVKSPIVGTFYRSASPDKPAYVSVGDTIQEGSVVCIVEAMKLFNEIESEVSGKIVKVMIDDASPVEYDQVLFLVDPNG
jgi:acetyl-CoA carboxylase biotin carboxyl carrier protein